MIKEDICSSVSKEQLELQLFETSKNILDQFDDNTTEFQFCLFYLRKLMLLIEQGNVGVRTTSVLRLLIDYGTPTHFEKKEGI
jgi:hypothetical protein